MSLLTSGLDAIRLFVMLMADDAHQDEVGYHHCECIYCEDIIMGRGFCEACTEDGCPDEVGACLDRRNNGTANEA